MNQVETRCRALGRTAAIWLDRAGPFRRKGEELLRMSTGLAPGQVAAALDAAFVEVAEEKLNACAASERFDREPERLRVGHVLAGNVFTSWLPGAVLTLLAGHDCWLKPSSVEAVFPRLWRQSLEEAAPELAGRVRILSWTEMLAAGPEVLIVYGSDQAVSEIAGQLRPSTHLVAYGHKESCALWLEEALFPENRRRLHQQVLADVLPFDLEGCLSPRVIYLERRDPEPFASFFEGLAAPPRLCRFEDWEPLAAELSRSSGLWSTLGVAGSIERVRAFQPRWQDVGFSRLCPFGQMQRPPLGWRNGGLWLPDEFRRAAAGRRLAMPDGKA